MIVSVSVLHERCPYHIFTGVVNFNHYFGCQKCVVRGKYFKQYKVMSFPNIDCTRRTNQSFRIDTHVNHQKEHHNENKSKIEEIHDVDMVLDFPTSDPLHLLELGVMKRCLIRWKEGTKSYKHKFKTADLNFINSLLFAARAEMPSEIHRSIRDLNCLHFWKGTEFRTFLLYLGVVVLKDVLLPEEYENFKILTCATILCYSNAYRQFALNKFRSKTLINHLFSEYIETHISLYGEHTIGSNVHNLSHIEEDVIRFGDLNSISTYPFENCLRTMKLKLRAMNNPLQQISRRVGEIAAVLNRKPHSMNGNVQTEQNTELKFPLQNDKTKFQVIFLNDFRLSSLKLGDKYFMDTCKRIIEFNYATKIDGQVFLHGHEIPEKNNFFTHPFSSSLINIYISDSIIRNEIICKFTDIKCKMLRLKYKSDFVFQPLLHTLK